MTRTLRRASGLLLALALASPAAGADEEPPLRPLVPEASEPSMTREAFEASLRFRQGTVALGDGLATLRLSDAYRYLGPEDSDRVLVQAWGNPPGIETLGMIFPAGLGPLDDGGFGVVLSYSDDGHVADDDAAGLDYAALLASMQDDAREGNADRTEAGYPTVELVGWAAPPHYDAATHKLYWAKELAFGDEPGHVLNYDVRVLGRSGVLVLQAVGAIEARPTIESAMHDLLGQVDFDAGKRYADFDPQYDKVAAYGIGALIAGKVLAKAGLFKWLIALVLAGKKLLIPIALGAGAVVARLLRRRPVA